MSMTFQPSVPLDKFIPYEFMYHLNEAKDREIQIATPNTDFNIARPNGPSVSKVFTRKRYVNRNFINVILIRQ